MARKLPAAFKANQFKKKAGGKKKSLPAFLAKKIGRKKKK